MRKNTSSDDLKQLLAETVGGKAADWKRVSKSKTSDGQTVREFKNAHIGSMTIYTGTDGIHRDGGGFPLAKHEREKICKLEEEANAQFQKQMTNAASKPGDEAAAARLASLLSYEDEKFTFETDPEEKDRIIANLTEKAGRALAKHFVFALHKEDDFDLLTAMITSSLHWAKNGCCDDQTPPVGHLLPRQLSESMESTWEWDGAEISPSDLAKKLQQSGFIWNRGFQEFIDNTLTQEISDGLNANPIKKSGKKQAPKP